jgi:hypothetical protein
MQAKQLVVLSGMAMAFVAGPAFAQTGTGNQQDRRQTPTQDRQDRLQDASQAARDRDSRFGSSTNILTSLEGIWNVNVQVNRSNWDMMNRGMQTDRRTPGQDGTGLDTTNPQQRDRQGVDVDTDQPQTQREREARERLERERQERENNPGTERGDQRQPGMQDGAQSQMGTADGLARSQAILGGDILRTTLIFGAEAASTRTNPAGQDRQDQDRNPQRDQQDRNGQNPGDLDRAQPRDGMTTTTTGGMMDNNSLRSVSFLGYNEGTGEYNLVLMTAHGGGIHYFTGQYDQSDRRIIFTSADSGSTRSTPAGSQRDVNDGQPATRGAVGDTGSMSVVLQLEGNDSYTVTAYRGTATTGSTVGSGVNDTQPALGGQPERRDRDANPGQDGATQTSIAPNVIYKATYTKADNTMRSQYDRIFDEREQAERRTPVRVR